MTKEQVAAALNGRQMGDEINDIEAEAARNSGLLVVFGYSDDNMELRGAFKDELGCYGGATFYLHREGVLPNHDARECECAFCGYARLRRQCATLGAQWDVDGYSWTYHTKIPHATFEVREDEEKFCRGIVINVQDLPKITALA